MPRRRLIRALLATGAGLVLAVAAAVVCAVVLAVADLYLSGHGFASIRTPIVESSALSLSLADVFLLVVVGVSGLGIGMTVWKTFTD